MSGYSAYHDRLPYGERVAVEPVLGDPLFPFEGEITVRALERPIVPEPPRRGEPDGARCGTCADPGKCLVWRDERWAVYAGFEPVGLPMMALLTPVEHVSLHSMGPDLVAGLGAMIQRLAVAIGRIDGVGRTHFSRWGDGAEHFHMWFLARPLGMMQLRGAMLAVWNDLLPRVPDAEFAANARTVAAALAEGGGRAVSR
ncbi:MAG TPA: hypothetical protein VFV67_14800 [Actinophytocola sp.]|uniref:hypothetical protein n=1 Tax=Actinophytocola sp. TaxID=1872138 RepID=UPI002DB96E04|nr:hypothetical protein [Actinophytocola sp.]HEU5471918.1 hypothetical protein [Actinophytocola sp.]